MGKLSRNEHALENWPGGILAVVAQQEGCTCTAEGWVQISQDLHGSHQWERVGYRSKGDVIEDYFLMFGVVSLV